MQSHGNLSFPFSKLDFSVVQRFTFLALSLALYLSGFQKARSKSFAGNDPNNKNNNLGRMGKLEPGRMGKLEPGRSGLKENKRN